VDELPGQLCQADTVRHSYQHQDAWRVERKEYGAAANACTRSRALVRLGAAGAHSKVPEIVACKMGVGPGHGYSRVLLLLLEAVTGTHVPSSCCWRRPPAVPQKSNAAHAGIRERMPRHFSGVRESCAYSKDTLHCKDAGELAALGSQKLKRRGHVRIDDLSKRVPLDRIKGQSGLLRPNLPRLLLVLHADFQCALCMVCPVHATPACAATQHHAEPRHPAALRCASPRHAVL